MLFSSSGIWLEFGCHKHTKGSVAVKGKSCCLDLGGASPSIPFGEKQTLTEEVELEVFRCLLFELWPVLSP